MNQNPQDLRRRQSGFTLVEIMVVIVILGLLATMVATNVLTFGDDAKITTAKTSVKNISEAVKYYYLAEGHLPEDLSVLVEPDERGRTYLEALEKDPWGEDFILTGENRNDYAVISCGPDRQEGTDDDISSRTKEE